jgi:recX family
LIVSEVISLNTKKSKVIFQDGESLALYNGEIRRLDIAVGRDIDEEEYYTTIYLVLKKRAFARLMHILEKSFKSENDIVKKLKLSFYPDEAIKEAIEKAKKFGYIDDDRYAERYINTYKDKYSKMKLKYKLLEKGINKEIIDNALESFIVDEEPMIKKLLNKKHYFETEEPDKKQKIIASVMRQGFKYQKIKDVIKDTSMS